MGRQDNIRMAAFAGLNNGQGGELYAVGGNVVYSHTLHEAGVFATRRNLTAPPDPWVEANVLPHLNMSVPRTAMVGALSSFVSWFTRTSPLDTVYVYDHEVDPRIEADLMDLWKKSQEQPRIPPGIRVLRLADLLLTINIGKDIRAEFDRKVLGIPTAPNYHPGALANDRVRLACAAVRAGANPLRVRSITDK